MMLTLFQIESREKQTTSTMKFQDMSSDERRTWFLHATTRVKSYTRKSFRKIAEEIREKVPSMDYTRLRSIRAKSSDQTRLISPYPDECRAVVELYADVVPDLLSKEEQTFKDRAEAMKKENERIERRIAELMHEQRQLKKENEKLKAENEQVSSELEDEKAKRNEIETELKSTKEELLDLMRRQINN